MLNTREIGVFVSFDHLWVCVNKTMEDRNWSGGWRMCVCFGYKNYVEQEQKLQVSYRNFCGQNQNYGEQEQKLQVSYKNFCGQNKA